MWNFAKPVAELSPFARSSFSERTGYGGIEGVAAVRFGHSDLADYALVRYVPWGRIACRADSV